MQHLLSYYRKNAQMQQRVLEAMVGELKQARRSAKELARAQDENAALREKLVAWEDHISNRSTQSGPGELWHGTVQGLKIASNFADDNLAHDVSPTEEQPSEEQVHSKQLSQFYRPQPMFSHALHGGHTKHLTGGHDNMDFLPRKRVGSPMEHVRAALRYGVS